MILTRLSSRLPSVAPRFTRAGSTEVGAWGPLQFSGNNWVGKGALPFGFKNRVVWYTSFGIISTTLFLIPFIQTEIKVGPARAAAKAKAKEASA